MWNKNKKCIICWWYNPNSMSKTCWIECALIRERKKQKHNNSLSEFQKWKSIKQISDKKKERLKNWWGEKDLFIKVWAERTHICEICNKQILLPQSFCFAHRYAKGQYPALRVLKSNISLVCSINCHNELDKRINLLKKEYWIDTIKNMILDWKEKEIKDLIKKSKR